MALEVITLDTNTTDNISSFLVGVTVVVLGFVMLGVCVVITFMFVEGTPKKGAEDLLC